MSTADQYDLVIRSGNVVDGTDIPLRQVDIAIIDDHIVAVDKKQGAGCK